MFYKFALSFTFSAFVSSMACASSLQFFNQEGTGTLCNFTTLKEVSYYPNFNGFNDYKSNFFSSECKKTELTEKRQTQLNEVIRNTFFNKKNTPKKLSLIGFLCRDCIDTYEYY